MEISKDLIDTIKQQIKIDVVRDLKKYIENEIRSLKKKLLEKNQYMSVL